MSRLTGFLRTHRSLSVSVAFAVLTIAVFLVFETPMTEACQRLLAGSREHSQWVLAVAFALLVSDILLPIPSSIVIALAGAAAGPLAATAVATLGLTASAGLGYFMGKRVPETVASESVQSLYRRLGFDLLVAVSRAIPVLAESVSVFAGSARKPLGRFLVASFLGCAGYAGLVSWGAAKLAGEG